MWPQLGVQAIRFPESGLLDTGTTAGPASGYQVRAGLSFSALDLFRGVRVLRVGSADCEQHEAGEAAQEVLTHGFDVARLAALRSQASYLDAHRGEWQTVVAKAEERHSARVITLIELDALRGSADALERRWAQVHGDIEQLEARTRDLPQQPLDRLAESYVQHALRFDREVSSLRSLDPWQFRLTAGLVPHNAVDWYGMAEISFNLGGFMRAHQERLYLDARNAELRYARYEVNSQLHDLRKQAGAAVAQMRQELAIVARELSLINVSRLALEKSDAPSIAQARDALAMHALSLESDRAFLDTFLLRVASLSKDHDDH